MVDKLSYPQIPATVWWGLRAILKRSPSVAITENLLGVELDVQEVAARQYVTELKRVGILNDENKATALAQKWRHDETYAEAVDELLKNVYPEALIHIAPRGAADRQKIVSWFTREGLGSGTAGNKAATYLLISSELPNEAPSRGNVTPQKTLMREASQAKRTTTPPVKVSSEKANEGKSPHSSFSPMPLNINVQIHISAEAASEQIESIFSAMRRYLYDGTNN